MTSRRAISGPRRGRTEPPSDRPQGGGSRPSPPPGSGGLGHAARVATGIVRCRFDRRGWEPRPAHHRPQAPATITMSPRSFSGMEMRAGQVVVHYVEHGTGRPVLVLHGAGVDHREAEACFEPVLEGVAGLRRIYPDLPGMGRTIAPDTLRSADDVLDMLLDSPTRSVAGLGISSSVTRRARIRAGDGREAPGAGRWSGARLSVAARTARRPRAPRRCRIGGDR